MLAPPIIWIKRRFHKHFCFLYVGFDRPLNENNERLRNIMKLWVFVEMTFASLIDLLAFLELPGVALTM